MPLRKRKQETAFAEEPPMSLNAILILGLLTNVIHYDLENHNNKNNISYTEYVSQQIRDYREFFYLIEYYSESLKSPIFASCLKLCRTQATSVKVYLTSILNSSIQLSENDKRNAIGLLNDIKNVLELIKNI